MTSPVQVLHGDCLDLMKALPDASVDMVLADLPYGMTACKWDSVIPLEPLWTQYERVIKPKGAIVLTAAQPFTSALVMSRPKLYRHAWVWNKKKATGHLRAKLQPLRLTEDVLVFSKSAPPYFPQMVEGEPYRARPGKDRGGVYNTRNEKREHNPGLRYPKTLLEFAFVQKPQHPTQKPTALFEYLIKTYTQPGDLVLDNVAGSGTTGVAALRTGRRAVLMEQDEKYIEVIRQRLAKETET
ncbi:site-specific DNA-methyltransferase [Deinococcus sp. SDU3-2]|uniref:Methyltransferase n=1 Tax=Deinococcus terrestris TaxID=2651870 RepID=A0A7X1NXN5_9DEIO|nr:site-specific DNA-methyltransferase [Deinococcus terrestris]MPY67703.1 site-specific DNA-methyltransferase [Deinococcus terrestris]